MWLCYHCNLTSLNDHVKLPSPYVRVIVELGGREMAGGSKIVRIMGSKNFRVRVFDLAAHN